MDSVAANFFPRKDEAQVNGHIGWASIVVGGAVRINGVSVFKNDEGKLNIVFPNYEKDGKRVSRVVPKTPEAMTQMTTAVENAVNNPEKNYGFANGKMGPEISIYNARATNEKYADARFSLDIGDTCTLRGFSTRVVTKTEGDKERSFPVVDVPSVGEPYLDSEGKKVYKRAFEGLTAKWKDKDGNEHSKDYGRIIAGMIMNKRKELVPERKAGLEDQIKSSEDKRGNQDKDTKSAPAKENDLSI